MADAAMTPEQLARWRDFCGANVKWHGTSEPAFYGIDYVNSGQPYPKHMAGDNAAREMLRLMEATHG